MIIDIKIYLLIAAQQKLPSMFNFSLKLIKMITLSNKNNQSHVDDGKVRGENP